MLRRVCLVLLCAALAFGLAAQTATRTVYCLVLVTEGDSVEGTALYMRYMGIQPELLRSFAPARFTIDRKGFSIEAGGSFRYSAGESEPLERYGRTVLNAVKAEIGAPMPPKVWKSVEVEVEVAELAAGGDAVQPGARAIELAARKLKLTKGQAWIERMELVSPGLIRAVVNFVK